MAEKGCFGGTGSKNITVLFVISALALLVAYLETIPQELTAHQSQKNISWAAGTWKRAESEEVNAAGKQQQRKRLSESDANQRVSMNATPGKAAGHLRQVAMRSEPMTSLKTFSGCPSEFESSPV